MNTVNRKKWTMKVTALNGSPREHGNTSTLIRVVLSELENEGIRTECLQLGGKNIHGCRACGKCREEMNGKCIVDDDLNAIFESVFKADGIIIGSPTYFSNVSTEVKAFIDRAGLVSMANGRLLRRKTGAAVVAVRRAGAANVFDAVNKFFLINQMIVPGSCYWNLGIGQAEGEVKDDDEGMRTMSILGQNMAWLLNKLHQTEQGR